jgi:hypothetical protein
MNEVELIRKQLSLERKHAFDVASALSTAGAGSDEHHLEEPFRAASVDYLVWILTRFEEREQTFHDLLERVSVNDAERRAAEQSLALSGTSREALSKLEAALGSEAGSLIERVGRWTDFQHFFTGPWSARRDALDALFSKQAKVTDWRTASGIDADSIFEERTRYARVRAALPIGVDLPAPTVRA